MMEPSVGRFTVKIGPALDRRSRLHERRAAGPRGGHHGGTRRAAVARELAEREAGVGLVLQRHGEAGGIRGGALGARGPAPDPLAQNRSPRRPDDRERPGLSRRRTAAPARAAPVGGACTATFAKTAPHRRGAVIATTPLVEHSPVKPPNVKPGSGRAASVTSMPAG